MASTGKNKHKLKGKTLNLNDFLEKDTNYVVSSKHTDWATEMENAPEEEFEAHPFKTSIDRSILPTAPRAARGPDIDMNRVPTKAPFIAFLGNLPFNMDQEAIQRFFRGMNVISVRLPKGNEAGRKRGFGYAEFADRESLLLALAMNNETLMNRKIRIDLAENEKEDKDRRGDDKSDRTAGDWRRPDSDFTSFNRSSRDDRDRNDKDDRDDQPDRTAGDWRRVPDIDDRDSRNDRFQEPSDRNFDDRDRGFDRDRGDRGYNDRSGFNDRYERMNRGNSSDRDRGYGSDRERGYNDRGRGDRYDRNDRFGGNRFSRDGERDQERGGFDRNSRRTFGSGFSNDRDGFSDDRRRDDRFGSLNRRGGFGDSRYERSGSPDKYREENNESEKDHPRERPKLVLKPRSVPTTTETITPVPAQTQASIFGGAKPVDTAARERQIEERLARERASEDSDRIRPQESRDRERESDRERDSRDRDDTITERKEKDKDIYSGSPPNYLKEEKDFNNRKTSSSSIKSDKSGTRSRVDSEKSVYSHSETDEEKDRREVFSGKPPSPKKEDSKAVPAPVPKENAWQKRAAAVVTIPPSGSSREREHSRDRAGSDRENRPGYNTTPRTKRKSSSGSSISNGPRRASVDYGRERRPSIEQRPPSGRRGSEDATSYGFWDKRRDTSRNRARDDSRNRRQDDQIHADIPPQRSREDNHWDRGRGRGDRATDRGRGRSDRGGDRQFDRGGDRQFDRGGDRHFDRGGERYTQKGIPRDISDRPPRRVPDRVIKYEEPKPVNWTNVNKYSNLLLDDDDTSD